MLRMKKARPTHVPELSHHRAHSAIGRGRGDPAGPAAACRRPPHRAGREVGVPESRAPAGDRAQGPGTAAAPPESTQGWSGPAARGGRPPRGAGWARGGRGAGGRGGRGGGAAAGGGRVPSPAQGPQWPPRSQATSRERPGTEGLTGRRGAQSRYRPLRDPRRRPPSLPGPVRAPAARARRPRSPLPAPRGRILAATPAPGLWPRKSSSSWGRIPGEGARILWNSGPITREENQPKFLLSHRVKLENIPRTSPHSPVPPALLL